MTLKEQIDIERLPKHIAIIMDGNGRWAKQHGRPRIFGHHAGVKSVREMNEACLDLGVQHLTLYTFSTENWKRPIDEVSGIMTLLSQTIKRETKTFLKNGVRLDVIGDIDRMPWPLADQLQRAMEDTSQGDRMVLHLALSYSGRWDITNAARKMAQEIKDGLLQPSDITEDTFANYLATAGTPDPELLIRTSGEYRISNFLMWQLAYSELYFTDVHWPDFSKEELIKACEAYSKRDRRFGGHSEDE